MDLTRAYAPDDIVTLRRSLPRGSGCVRWCMLTAMKTCRTPFPSLGGSFPLSRATVVLCDLIILINTNSERISAHLRLCLFIIKMKWIWLQYGSWCCDWDTVSRDLVRHPTRVPCLWEKKSRGLRQTPVTCSAFLRCNSVPATGNQ